MFTLITGGFGYVGSSFLKLIDQNEKIIILDNLLHKYYDKKLIKKNFIFIKQDINKKKKLENIFKKYPISNVIHLAAIVGDPASKKNSRLTKLTNKTGSKNLFDLSKKYKVNKFIFFSTCSNYGLSKTNNFLSEKSKLNPISLYAKSKIYFEKMLIKDKSKIKKIIMRISTLYGVSPRMRYDLTINQFTKEIFLNNKLDVYDPDTWRPYLHLKDLYNIVFFFLNYKKLKKVNIYNIGYSSENYTKNMICKKILNNFKNKNSLIKYVSNFSNDRRNYKITFSKFEKLKVYKKVKISEGINEIVNDLKKSLIRRKKLKVYSN